MVKMINVCKNLYIYSPIPLIIKMYLTNLLENVFSSVQRAFLLIQFFKCLKMNYRVILKIPYIKELKCISVDSELFFFLLLIILVHNILLYSIKSERRWCKYF